MPGLVVVAGLQPSKESIRLGNPFDDFGSSGRRVVDHANVCYFVVHLTFVTFAPFFHDLFPSTKTSFQSAPDFDIGIA